MGGTGEFTWESFRVMLLDQTPFHDVVNAELLSIIPQDRKSVIEIGCMSGALARAYKAVNKSVHYMGIDIHKGYLEHAAKYCDTTDSFDIEEKDDYFYRANEKVDCWIFGDVLEHLRNPWSVLSSIRSVIPANGVVAACIPNAQHWSLIAKLAVGDFRYENSGLLDKTHLRWFTRQTAIELFTNTGFDIVDIKVRVLNGRSIDQKFLGSLVDFAVTHGVDNRTAISDLLTFQYILLAKPSCALETFSV